MTSQHGEGMLQTSGRLWRAEVGRELFQGCPDNLVAAEPDPLQVAQASRQHAPRFIQQHRDLRRILEDTRKID
jgi:hypothetical protein